MWRLGVGSICGLNGQVWVAAEIHARCTHADGSTEAPHLFDATCPGACGVNAFRTAAHLMEAAQRLPGPRRLAPSSPHVATPIPEGLYGTVELWGRVVEHDHGYRAQHARVSRLVMVHGLSIRATSDHRTVAAQFPNPAGARRPFELGFSVADASDLPPMVERLLVSGSA